MENPAQDISAIVVALTTAPNADVQKATLHRYYTHDAGFRHPLCTVNPGPRSRENILGIYQWYRVMSPTIQLEVKSVTYNKKEKLLLLDVAQIFHIRISPFKPAPSRLLVRLTLREENGLFYISLQEDFYHPDDLAALVIPPLSPFIRGLLAAAGLASDVFAKIAQVLGYWRTGETRPGDSEGDMTELKWE